MRDAKGKGKETEKEEVKASTPGSAEESRASSRHAHDDGRLLARADGSTAETSLLSRIGASASGLAREVLMGEGARGDAVRRGVEGLVARDSKGGGGGGSGSGSGSQEFGGGSAQGMGLRLRERERQGDGGQAGMAGEKGESIGEHIQRNEEEFSAFLDGVEDLDGGFGHGVDSTESQDERSGRAATDPKRPFERRAHREPVSAGPVEDSGLCDIPSESAAERGHGSRGGYGETPEMFHPVVSGDPQDANAVPWGWEGVWSRASDLSTLPSPSPSSVQRQDPQGRQSNIDGTSLGQSAHPSITTSTSTPADVLAQESHDGEDVIAVLNARIADGELGEQYAVEREVEREMGIYGEERYWEKVWGLDGEQRVEIVGMVRGLGVLETGFQSDESLWLVPDYERGGRRGGEKWKSEWEAVLNGYVDEVWGGLLPLVKEARGELKDEGGEGGAGKERRELKALRRLEIVLGHLRGGYGGGG